MRKQNLKPEEDKILLFSSTLHLRQLLIRLNDAWWDTSLRQGVRARARHPSLLPQSSWEEKKTFFFFLYRRNQQPPS